MVLLCTMKPKAVGLKKNTKVEKSDSLNGDFVKLGKRMRELRIKKGFNSFEAFAYENDLPRMLYGNYKQGVGNITYKNLLKVVKALGVSISDFFSEGFD